MARHNLQTIELVTAEVFAEQLSVRNQFLRDDVQATACGQRGKDDRMAQIGSKGRDGCVARPRRQVQSLLDRIQIVEELAMLDAHTLRCARRAGSESHV